MSNRTRTENLSLCKTNNIPVLYVNRVRISLFDMILALKWPVGYAGPQPSTGTWWRCKDYRARPPWAWTPSGTAGYLHIKQSENCRFIHFFQTSVNRLLLVQSGKKISVQFLNVPTNREALYLSARKIVGQSVSLKFSSSVPVLTTQVPPGVVADILDQDCLGHVLAQAGQLQPKVPHILVGVHKPAEGQRGLRPVVQKGMNKR